MNYERASEIGSGSGAAAPSAETRQIQPTGSLTYSVVDGALAGDGPLAGLVVRGAARLTSIVEESSNSRWVVTIDHTGGAGRYRHGYESQAPNDNALWIGWEDVEGDFDIAIKVSGPSTGDAFRAASVGMVRPCSEDSGRSSGFVGFSFGSSSGSAGDPTINSTTHNSRRAAGGYGTLAWADGVWLRCVREGSDIRWYNKVDDEDPWIERTLNAKLDVVGTGMLGFGFGCDNNQTAVLYLHEVLATFVTPSA